MGHRHIAIVTPDYPPHILGGCAVSTNLLVQQLRKKKIFVDVFTFSNYDHSPKSSSYGTDYYFKAVPKWLLVNNLLIIFRLWLRLADYQIIHVMNVSPIPAITCLKKLNRTKAKVVATINNLNAITPNPISFFTNHRSHLTLLEGILAGFHSQTKKGRLLGNLLGITDFIFMKSASRGADIYIAQTEAIKSIYTTNGFDSDKFLVIPNMYDPAFQSKPLKKQTNQSVRLLYVGALAEKKGVWELIQSYAALPEVVKKKSKLVICGRGKLQDQLQKFIVDQQLSTLVDITWRQYSQLPDLYANSDVVVHPAKWPEPFSRVWTEAMTSRCAILSSDNPSAREVLANCAEFFDVTSSTSITQALQTIISNKQLLTKLQRSSSTAARRYQPELITHSVITQAYD